MKAIAATNISLHDQSFDELTSVRFGIGEIGQ